MEANKHSWIYVKVEGRQSCVSRIEPHANGVKRCVEIVGCRGGTERRCERDVPHAMIAKKEAVVEDDVHSAPEER